MEIYWNIDNIFLRTYKFYKNIVKILLEGYYLMLCYISIVVGLDNFVFGYVVVDGYSCFF